MSDEKSDYIRRKRARNYTSPVARVASTIEAITGQLDIPDPRRIFGIDTSTHVEGVPNWEIARLRGCRFADIKVINGILEVPRWRESWARAKAAGIPRIAYGWAYPSIPGRSAGGQARKFVDLLKTDPPELGYEVDFEWTYGGNPTLEDLYGYLIPLEQVTGRKPIVYTGWFWREALDGGCAYGRSDPFWAQFPLHIAAYGTTTPSIPLPWTRAMFHQWTEKGDGLALGFNPYDAREIDLNYFMGNDAEFQALGGGQPVIISSPSTGSGTAPGSGQGDGDPGWEPLFDGAARIRHAEFLGARYHMIELDLAKWDIEFGVGAMMTSTYLGRRQLQIAINGLDGWYADKKRGRVLAGRVLSKGRMYIGRDEEAVLYISRSNQFTLKPQYPLWNASAFPNLLVLNGQIPAIHKSELDKRARTAFGVDQRQTKAYLVIVDGDDRESNGAGLSVQSLALLMEAYCELAVMGDSGGSTTMAINRGNGPEIIGNPSGEMKVNVGGKQYRLRPVQVSMGFKLKE